MMMFSDTELDILAILLDEEGHALWNIAEILNKEPSNLAHVLRRLEKREIIYRGKPRTTTKDHKTRRSQNYKEFPYYINNDLVTFDTIIDQLADHLLRGINDPTTAKEDLCVELFNSTYIKDMIGTHRESVLKRLKTVTDRADLRLDDFLERCHQEHKKYLESYEY